MPNSIRRTVFLLVLLASSSAEADVYGPTDATLTLNGSNCLKGKVNWVGEWGALPGVRAPFNGRNIALVERTSANPSYYVNTPQGYPFTATVQPNTCAWLGIWTRYYRLQVYAWKGAFPYDPELNEVSFVSNEVFAPLTSVPGPCP